MSSKDQSQTGAQQIFAELLDSFTMILIDLMVFAFFLIAIPLALLFALVMSLALAIAGSILGFVIPVVYTPVIRDATRILYVAPLLSSGLIGLVAVDWLYPFENDDGEIIINAIGEDNTYPVLVVTAPVVLLIGYYLSRGVGNPLTRPDLFFDSTFLSTLGKTPIGNLIVFLALHRAASYGIIVSRRLWNSEKSLKTVSALAEFPGIVTFLGFSWLAGATQYKLFSIVGGWLGWELSDRLYIIFDQIPGITPTAAVGAFVPLILAGSILPYVWLRRLQSTGGLKGGILNGVKTVRQVSLLSIRLLHAFTRASYKAFKYIMLIPPKDGGE